MNVDVGDSVNVDCDQYHFSALAIVRNRQTSEYELPKIHLEFIDAVFPIEVISLPGEKNVSDDDEIRDYLK